jgi:hypothetical protein
VAKWLFEVGTADDVRTKNNFGLVPLCAVAATVSSYATPLAASTPCRCFGGGMRGSRREGTFGRFARQPGSSSSPSAAPLRSRHAPTPASTDNSPTEDVALVRIQADGVEGGQGVCIEEGGVVVAPWSFRVASDEKVCAVVRRRRHKWPSLSLFL